MLQKKGCIEKKLKKKKFSVVLYSYGAKKRALSDAKNAPVAKKINLKDLIQFHVIYITLSCIILKKISTWWCTPLYG